MRKKNCFCSIFSFSLIIVCSIMIWYKKPKEYCVLEETVEMCDETGKIVHVTWELYLYRYFFKGSEIHGNIYVDETKYTSIFDLENCQQVAKELTRDNSFLAKLSGEQFTVPFINVGYWAMLRDRGYTNSFFMRFFMRKSIDGFQVFPAEEIFMFSVVDENLKCTIYLGSAKNTEEYNEVMKKLAKLSGAIQD